MVVEFKWGCLFWSESDQMTWGSVLVNVLTIRSQNESQGGKFKKKEKY